MTWVFEYVEENIPDDPRPAVNRLGGMDIYPHIALCDQCDEECDAACDICGAGLHSLEHADRHGLGKCEGENHWMVSA